MGNKQRRLKVFLSHAKEDNLQVRKLYQYLKNNGINAWLDEENLLPGQEWRIEIANEVRKADVVVVCLSSASVSKEGFAQAEINFALEKALEKPEVAIYIIPAKLEECSIPNKLSRWHWVNLFEENGYEKLLNTLKVRADEINAATPVISTPKDLETVQIILEGNFSEFTENRRDEVIGILAALLHMDKSSIRVLRAYSGSIIMEIELTTIGANRLLKYFEKDDFRLKSLGIISIKLLEAKKKNSSAHKKTSKKTQVSKDPKNSKENLSIIINGDVTESNIVVGSENKVSTLTREVDNGNNTETKLSMKSKKLVPNRILENWLNMHSLITNPFGDDLKGHPFYPAGITRPDQWEAFLDPDSLIAHCEFNEDALALSYLLQEECTPTKRSNFASNINLGIFPIRVWHQQTTTIQPALATLAQSATQSWLSILAARPNVFSKLPQNEQRGVLGLLLWSMKSDKTIVESLFANGLEDNEATSVLRYKIIETIGNLSVSDNPHQSILFSWLQINPLEKKQTYLILMPDNMLLPTPEWWFNQLNSLISKLSTNGVFTKAFSSTPLPALSNLQDVELSWSDKRLKQSLEGQFNAAMDPEERKMMGVVVSFCDLFGFGATEQETTERLISASKNSLARMLMLGNRLLQEHCHKAATEKYLSTEELDDIIKTA